MARKGKAVTIQGTRQIEFLCPAHDDHHPSAQWHPKKMVWTCRACGAGGGWRDACARLGLDIDRLQAGPSPVRQTGPGPRQEPTRVYLYKAKGIEFRKARYEFPEELTEDGKPKKSFVWSPKFSDHDVSASDMPLYWMEDPAMRPTDPVIFVEGEKVVEACWQRQLLVCCAAWSASQRDFGQAFEALRGRDVWLSADNDEVGYVYMQAVAEALKGVAKSVHWVRVPLGPKEDLFDFFAHGGKREALFEGDLSETAVIVQAADHLVVRVPTSAGIIRFEVEELSFTARSIDCEVAVSIEGPGFDHKPFTQRKNLLSDSALSGLRTDLAKFLGTPKELNWVAILNEVVAVVRATQRTVDYSIDVFDIPERDEREQFLIDEILPRDQPAIFFGDGESLKSYLALMCCVSVILGEPFPGTGRRPEFGRVMYLDFENIGPKDFRHRLGRLLKSLGLPIPPDVIRYWPSRGIPLHNQVGAIARFVKEHNIRLVVVDGIIGAITGKPEDSDVASLYFQDLGRLETTTLSIAHVTKSVNGVSSLKPYGSAFWHNLARRTWYIQRSGGGDDAEVGMYCRKVNEGPRPAPVALGVHFTGRTGPVEIIDKSFLEVDRTLDRLRAPHERLADVLRNGSQYESDIAKALGSKEDTVRTWLKKYPNLFQDTSSGWELAALG